MNYKLITERLHLLEDYPIYDGEKLSGLPKLLVNRLNRRWHKSSRVFTIDEYNSMHKNYWTQRSQTIETAVLSAEDTSKLAVKCRKHNVTMNSLLLSSLLKAAYGIDSKNTNVGMAVNIRSSEDCFGNYASAVSIKHTYDNRKSIWENALVIQKIVNSISIQIK